MSQAVSRRPLTAEERAQSQVSPCQICGGQSGSGTGFSSSTSVFPRQHHSINAPHLYSFLKLLLPEGQTDKAKEPSKKQSSFGNRVPPYTAVLLLSEIGYHRTQQYSYFRKSGTTVHSSTLTFGNRVPPYTAVLLLSLHLKPIMTA